MNSIEKRHMEAKGNTNIFAWEESWDVNKSGSRYRSTFCVTNRIKDTNKEIIINTYIGWHFLPFSLQMFTTLIQHPEYFILKQINAWIEYPTNTFHLNLYNNKIVWVWIWIKCDKIVEPELQSMNYELWSMSFIMKYFQFNLVLRENSKNIVL